MLIICNGAFKSGSTWVYELVNSILKVQNVPIGSIPSKYGNQRSPAMKIAEDRLHQFIQNEDLTKVFYLTKAHFFKEETLGVTYGRDVCFLFVQRDVRDAIVSHYHHFLVYKKIEIPFKVYYYVIGRYKAYEIWLFNERCKRYFQESNFFVYESMKKEITHTIQEICRLINLPQLSADELKKVAAETDIDSLRERAKSGDNTHYHGAGADNSKLFRKGKPGEYVNYFDGSMLEDINKITYGRTSVVFRLIYNILFTLRRLLTVPSKKRY